MATAQVAPAVVYTGEIEDVLVLANALGMQYIMPILSMPMNSPAIVSFWAKVESTDSASIMVKALGQVEKADISNKWSRIIVKVDSPSDLELRIVPLTNDFVYLYKGMVESDANIPSDWVAAPEDTDEMISESWASTKNVKAWFKFSDDGLETRKQGSKWYTLIDDSGFYINHDEVAGHVGAFYKERLEVHGIKIGDITVLSSGADNSGGWVWSD